MTERSRALRVTETVLLADGVLGLTLRDASGGQLEPWAPGAHIDLTLPSGTIRSYSLCGDPADRSCYRLAVRCEESGRGGSAEVHGTQLVGRELAVRGPRNNFPLADADAYLLIAGGIGITPLLPMARALAARGAAWSLLYLGRRRAAMAFSADVASISQAMLVPRDEAPRADLAAALDAAKPGTAVYCCGPASLIREVEELCAARGLGCHAELFGRPDLHSHKTVNDAVNSSPVTVPERSGGFDPDGAFEVEFTESRVTLTVGPDETILGRARALHANLSFSCTEGYCGSCETTVLAGIPDHRDTVLTDDEKAANESMMICVGRSRTPRLVLQL